MKKRTSQLETINGQQFLTRYHQNDLDFIPLKKDVIIGCSKFSTGILIYVRSEDGIFDYIGDIQIDKEVNDETEIFIHSTGIETINLNHSDSLEIKVNKDSLKNVTVKINDSKSKQFAEKKFFDF